MEEALNFLKLGGNEETPGLKRLCHLRNLKSTGSKKELITRLRQSRILLEEIPKEEFEIIAKRMKLTGTDRAEMEETFHRNYRASRAHLLPPLPPTVITLRFIENKTQEEAAEEYTRYLISEGRLATPEQVEKWERQYANYEV